MPNSPKLKLISFVLCPFVQRAVIVLRHKGVDFDIEYIDIANKPQWYLDKVPTGKVPALFVGDEVLFESAIINEYLDETTPPPLLSTDPWQRAQQRAWINYSDQLLMGQYAMMTAQNEDEFKERKEKLFATALPLAAKVAGPYFSGDAFSLVDAAVAPFLMRLSLLPSVRDELLGRVAADSAFPAWMERLLPLDTVKGSVKPEFAELWKAFFKERGVTLSLAA
ncbi:glutathione S-transferase family protein [Magnetovibrio sp.]|uniref:glutathione S-transferase family protein n=1 Tax=Magnetovibrio sp. TaxID=2024836 RepID=UPI002F92C478